MKLQSPRTLSLRAQILVSLSLLLITAVVLLGLVIINLSRNIFILEKRQAGIMVAEMLQRTLTVEKLPENVSGKDAMRMLAMRVSTRINDDRYLHFITFLDIADRVVWSTLPEQRWQDADYFSKYFPQPASSLTTAIIKNPIDERQLVLLQFPWKYKGAVFGRVQITLPIMQPENESLFSGWLILGIAAAYAGILILFGALLLNRMVTAPIGRMTSAIRRMTSGDHDVRLRENESAELSELAQSFNEMAQSLAENEELVANQIQELLDINEELELTRRGLIRSERLASVGQLAAGVAHEIGNPLSAILGYVGFLAEGGTDEATFKDILKRIEKDVIRIRSIVKGLLDYSRPGSSTIKRVDLNMLINDTIEILKPQKQFKNVNMVFDSHKRPACVSGDEGQLQQVLVNLLLNAAQAMQGEGNIMIFLEGVSFEPQVTFRDSTKKYRPGQKLLLLAIIDDGPGISEEQQRRIFAPFYTTKDPGQGTGLGLAICERILESHSGEIRVQSKPEEGATFSIILPEETKNCEMSETAAFIS